MVCVFYVQKILPTLRLQKLSPMFFSSSMVLAFKFSSVIYFKLVLIYGVHFTFFSK